MRNMKKKNDEKICKKNLIKMKKILKNYCNL